MNTLSKPGLILVLAILLSACSSLQAAPGETPLPTALVATPTTVAPAYGEARVESIQVLTTQTFPAQVSVVARGHLPDSCTTLDRVTQTRTDKVFQIKLASVRRADLACAQTLVPFDKVIALDLTGASPGIYSVNVNGVSSAFGVAASDVSATPTIAPSVTPTASPTPTPTRTPAPKTVSISGRVWHDLCDSGAVGQPAPPALPRGCVAAVQGGYRANGILENGEPGISRVRVSLGVGACPSTGLAAVTTNQTGAYTFAGLTAGTYCVSIAAAEAPNQSILLPGDWTWPGVGIGGATVTLAAGENRSGINFGWDYQFLPVPERCFDQAMFIQDVTIPDNTVVVPGAPFVKTWRLQNDGTCSWGSNYALVFIGGHQMGAPVSTPLPGIVPPGSTVDVSVNLIAPTLAGLYRGEWKLRNDQSVLFGVGAGRAAALYTQIVIEPPAPTPVRVNFPPGATSVTLHGNVQPLQFDQYILRALAGQRMTVEIISANPGADFGVQGLEDGQPLKRLHIAGKRWSDVLPATQDYLVTVAAQEGAADYTLIITITF